mgnify:CR=1 FL=1
MRIIAGEFKGRRLQFIKSPEVRPTMDRVKESLFNVLGGRLEVKNVLDLFAGSGSLGLEAISRGAEKVVFADQDRMVLKVLQQNIEKLGFSQSRDRIRVLGLAWQAALQRLKSEKTVFDLVFVDPPYTQTGVIRNVLMALGDSDILRPASTIVVEHSSRDKIQEETLPPGFRRYKELFFGGTALTFFEVNREK